MKMPTENDLETMKLKNNRKASIIITAVLVALMIAYFGVAEALDLSQKLGEDISKSLEMIVTRALGGLVFIVIISYLGYKVLDPFKKPFWRSILFCLPAFIVVVNNLPIYPLALGIASVTAPAWRIAMLAAECLMVGFFEETCFRGAVLSGFLEKRRDSVKDRFLSIIYSSAVFGAVHLVNILLG